MKRVAAVLAFLLVLSLLFVSSCNPVSTPEEEESREKEITLLSPLNESGYYPNEAFLRWGGIDGASSYKIYLSTEKDDVDNEKDSALVSTSSWPSLKVSVDYGEKYYWKVTAKSSDEIYKSPAWSFSTRDSADRRYLLALGEDSMNVLDIENPVGIVKVFQDTINSSISAFEATETAGAIYAFVAKGYDGISVYDFSDFTNPIEVASFLTSDRTYSFDLTLMEDKIFIARGYDGVVVVDVSTPEVPHRVKDIPADEYGDYYTRIKAFKTDDGREYILALSDNDKMMVINASSLEVATVLNFEDDLKIHSMFYDGKYLYVTNDEEGLSIYGVENFEKLEKLSSISVGKGFLSQEYDVFVKGNYAFIAADSIFAVVDVTDKTSPEVTAEIKVVGAKKIIHGGDKIYLIGDSLGSFSYWLNVVDVSFPENPKLLGTYRSLNGKAIGGAIFDDTFYLAGENGAILKLDVSQPVGISEKEKVDGYSGYRMSVSGNRVFAIKTDGYNVYEINGDIGLKKIYDSGFIGDGVMVSSVYTDDKNLYIGFIDGKVYIYSQESPEKAAEYPIDLRDYSASIIGIYTWEGHAYIASNNLKNGIFVIKLGETPTGSYEKFLPIDGVVKMVGKEGRIYVLTESAVYIVDITGPSDPEIISEVPVKNGVSFYVDSNGTIYVGTYEDINGSSKLVILNSGFSHEISLPSYVQSMERIGDYLYLSLFTDGIAVVDVSNIDSPEIVGWYSTVNAHDIKGY